MSQRNCPNCGAPLETNISKCRYCGTSYFDISAINIKDGEPFYLKFLHEMNGKTVEVTALVRAKPEITIHHEQETIHSGLCSLIVSTQVTLDMTFETVSPLCKCNESHIQFKILD